MKTIKDEILEEDIYRYKDFLSGRLDDQPVAMKTIRMVVNKIDEIIDYLNKSK